LLAASNLPPVKIFFGISSLEAAAQLRKFPVAAKAVTTFGVTASLMTMQAVPLRL